MDDPDIITLSEAKPERENIYHPVSLGEGTNTRHVMEPICKTERCTKTKLAQQGYLEMKVC